MLNSVRGALILTVVLSCFVAAHQDRLVAVQFPGIASIDLPASWTVHGRPLREQLIAEGKPLIDGTGLGRNTEIDTLLAATGSTPSIYASVLLVVNRRKPLSQADVSGMSDAELKSISERGRASFASLLNSGGSELREWVGISRERLNGLYVIVTEYRRFASEEGLMMVQVNSFHVGTMTLNLTLSYREAEARPVIEQIRSSFRVAQ